MRVSTLIPYLAFAGAVVANSNHGVHGKHHHHSKRKSGHCPARLSRNPINAAGNNPKAASAKDDAGSSSSSSASVSSTPVVQAAAKSSSSSSSSSWSSSSEWQEPSSSSSAAQASETAKDSGSSGSGDVSPIGHSGAGLFSFKDATCGPSGATKDITKMSGPNGSQDFLNCGVDGAGWTPPYITLDQLQTVALDESLEEDNSAFSACKPYLDTFNKVAGEYGFPPILLASIAMQESSCRPWLDGNDGSCGMMQLTKDKWPEDGSDCHDVEFNVRGGASYLSQKIKDNKGNILLALGNYNGWQPDMTYALATAARTSGCCRCQNNLSYMQQTLNGWLQGIDGSTLGDFDFGCDEGQWQ